ncbi:MAG: DUF945 domain-containing protein [Bacteroidetes bacterium]|nr:DUF945 domain-containing protein [Bacteroidota bacterium]
MAPSIGATAPIKEVSKLYTFVPTLPVVDLLRGDGWVPVQAKEVNVRIEEKKGFQKHLIRFQRNDLIITPEERVDIVLYNSHDRGCAFNLIASIWRKICSNGLMVSNDLLNFSHRHIGFDGNAFLESAQKIVASTSMIADQVDFMKSIELTPDDRGVFAITALEAAYNEPEKAPVTADRLLTDRRMDDKGKDLWTTFNVVQENLMKGGLPGRSKATGKRQRTRAVNSIDKDIKLNKLLWSLTERMAELKTAE